MSSQSASDISHTSAPPSGDAPFKDTWNIWFHRTDDPCWDIKSYRSISSFNSIIEFWCVINNLPSISAGMFFMMKEGIQPIYEDPQNMEGSIYSFRIAKRKFHETWQEVICACVANTLYPDSSAVNGVSCNPKNNVIKLWLKTRPQSNSPCAVTKSIENLMPDKALLSPIKPCF